MGGKKFQPVNPENIRVTFHDVAGIDEVEAEISEVVDFLKDPQKYQAIGARAPKGVLLSGPPGTGKTLLARATAGEAGVPFFHASSSEFVEMVVGVGASRVCELFQAAREAAPSIIFIDEIDAIGRKRGGSLAVGGHDEREQTLNQILTEMDGFSSSEGVVVLAATNRPDVLDPALLRPGRFDRSITVHAPDLTGRTQILQVDARNVRLDGSVDLNAIARVTPGMTGAELANLVNEAALLAVKRTHASVTQRDLLDALEKVQLGTARNVVMPPEERRRTAYHESGHALLGMLEAGADPVRKISRRNARHPRRRDTLPCGPMLRTRPVTPAGKPLAPGIPGRAAARQGNPRRAGNLLCSRAGTTRGRHCSRPDSQTGNRTALTEARAASSLMALH